MVTNKQQTKVKSSLYKRKIRLEYYGWNIVSYSKGDFTYRYISNKSHMT